MSHSRKKTPVAPMAGPKSQKKAKLFAHRAERKRVREAIHQDPQAGVFPHRREAYDNWHFPQEGKMYWGRAIWPKAMRK